MFAIFSIVCNSVSLKNLEFKNLSSLFFSSEVLPYCYSHILSRTLLSREETQLSNKTEDPIEPKSIFFIVSLLSIIYFVF